jgi:hypothetical protein
MDAENVDVVERYVDIILNSAAFSTLIGIISLLYAYYLYKKTISKSRLLIMSMSNNVEDWPRMTEIVLYNDGHKDLTKRDILPHYPIKFRFKKKLTIDEITIVYNSVGNRGCQLVKSRKNLFKIKFNIIQRKHAIVLKVVHDSKLHMDDTWREFKVQGTIIDMPIEHRDYSDQMVYRANSMMMPFFISSFIAAVLLTYAEKSILDQLSINVPQTYLLMGNFLIVMVQLSKWLLDTVGHREYRLFWKVLKASRKT